MMNISDIAIQPLTPQLYQDYLDFFDYRAFTDDNPNEPCYCTSPYQSEAEIKKMTGKFRTYGVKETLRRYAVRMLDENRMHGYLAFDKDISVGWCNAAGINAYEGFVPAFARDMVCGKTISIVCFEISPPYRGMGIASALIDRVCSDAKEQGYDAVEGYPNVDGERNQFDYHGSVKLYQKAGFVKAANQDGKVIMRKDLQII